MSSREPSRQQVPDPASQSVAFSDNICAEFEPIKKFSTHENPDLAPIITSFDYNDTGKLLVTTSIDHEIRLYNAMKGVPEKSHSSKKYGCDLARFTHDNNTLLHSSTLVNNDIRQLDYTKGEYVRYFNGHKGMVSSLEVSPLHNLFASAAMDDSVRLWDFRATNDQAFLPYRGPTKLAYDPSGMVLGASSVTDSKASLYDVRNIQGGAFKEFNLPTSFKWNKIEFSNDNKYILFSCINGDSLIFDAFTGEQRCRLVTQNLPEYNIQTHGSSAFSPDGKYVFAAIRTNRYTGSELPPIGVFDLKSIDPATNELPGLLEPSVYLETRSRRPRNIIFNPRYMQFCEGDVELFFWQPRGF